MARIRQVKPELFDDPDVGALPAAVRWVFAGLLTQADREGRVHDDPRRLKTRLCAYDDTDVSAALQILADAGLVIRYLVDGKRYVQIRTFKKHQRPHPKEPISIIPPIPEQNDEVPERSGEPGKETANRTVILVSGSLGSGSLGAGSLGSGSGGAGSSEDGARSALDPRAHSLAAARRPAQNAGVGAGTYPRDHLRCVQPCGRVCFPDTLFAEFVRAAGGDDPTAHVHAWHAAVNAAWGETGPHWTHPIGDDKFVFWRARWREDHSTTVTAAEAPPRSMFAPGTSTPELADALRQSLQEKRR